MSNVVAGIGEVLRYCMSPCHPARRRGFFVRFAAVAAVIGAVSVSTQPAPSQTASIQVEEAIAHHITVTHHKSRTLRLDRSFASTVVGAPEIADVLPMSDQVIYIQGKKIGTTNVSVFDQNKRLIAIVDVEVVIDTQSLTAQIRASTGSNAIRVSSSNGQLVLSGEARDAVAADRALSIAKATTPDTPVINAMRVSPSQQVMLRVRFLEASRDAGRDLGVNWFVANRSGTRGFNTGLGAPSQAGRTLQGTGPPETATPGGVPLFQALQTFAGSITGAPFGVALANLVNSRGGSIDVLITALETKGLLRRLAEPDLVALSGDTASFIAGGEIPVPEVQPGSPPTIGVKYKPFGVQLTFVPTVLANGIINLRLTPSVSEIDFANAVTINGVQIPALNLREARTTIELRDGQSFAIAGLLQTDGLRNIAQVPWLGSVPVLGALFRSTSFQQRETDLVVIVTPHLVQPAVPGQRIATPFDRRLPSNDLDLFLLGQTERRKGRSDTVAAGAALREPYGYIMPIETK
jgi:pilus assembly protein CpaC